MNCCTKTTLIRTSISKLLVADLTRVPGKTITLVRVTLKTIVESGELMYHLPLTSVAHE